MGPSICLLGSGSALGWIIDHATTDETHHHTLFTDPLPPTAKNAACPLGPH
ncbi:Conserved protein of unknown function [Mycobacterium canettii CIPT 140060008]|nr:Conserved protein of unknown function [Mycobacterium canettii CIPT 140060008]